MIYKNEINIDSVIHLLNLESLPEDLSKTAFMVGNGTNQIRYNKVIKTFLNYFFDSLYSIDSTIHNKDQRLRGVCLINEKMANSYMRDIVRVEFVSMYPNIMVKLWEDKQMKFNSDEFPILLKFLVRNKEVIRRNPKLERKSLPLLNFLINYTFMASMNKESLIQVDDANLVIGYYQNRLTDLFNSYPDQVIYIDTDVIYFDFLDNNILNKSIKQFGIPYKIDYDLNGIFFQKKKYITTQITGNWVTGFTPYHSKFLDEKEKMKRAKKIKTIKNKLNEKEIQRDNG